MRGLSNLTAELFFYGTDFGRRHKQLSEWVRRGIVPNPNTEPLVGRGQLTSVWLGGLANPGALMTSMKHEKAAMVGCTVDEVLCQILKCQVSSLKSFPKK